VTEATKKAARCFYALSQKRADQKRYPAVDATDSYSKYLEYPEVQNYLHEHVSSRWIAQVTKTKDVLLRGREVRDQINILGDDGVPLSYHVQFWKAEVIDFVILQQDAFDDIDAMTPMVRQKFMLELVLQINQMEFDFKGFEEVAGYFKRIINKLKQLNYSEFESDQFKTLLEEHKSIINEKRIA